MEQTSDKQTHCERTYAEHAEVRKHHQEEQAELWRENKKCIKDQADRVVKLERMQEGRRDFAERFYSEQARLNDQHNALQERVEYLKQLLEASAEVHALLLERMSHVEKRL